MSAFGKRGGIGGGRPTFGVAKPMKGSAGGGAAAPSDVDEGGDQFPPLDDLTPQLDSPSLDDDGGVAPSGAMDRLTARQNASGEAGSSKAEGL